MKKNLHPMDDALLSPGIVNKEQLNKAKETQKTENISLQDAIVKLGYSTYPEIIQFLSTQYGLPVINLDETDILLDIARSLPIQIVDKYKILPISRDNNTITIAVSSPPSFELLDNLRFMLSADIKCVLATPESIRGAINKFVRPENVDTSLKELTSLGMPVTEVGIEDFGERRDKEKEIEDEGPIIQLVTLIINKAITFRASDIHVEPLHNRLRIRYRVDGVCQEAEVLPKRLQDAIISRFKILANMDISEKRRPQDGRINVKHGGKELDIRVSCLPSIYGESIVMRLLEKSAFMLDLRNLGFYENDYKRFSSIINKPNGILLITGPTGSGKTTTLYAVINALNKPSTKIITAEDPVEYTIPGVNQSEISEKIGFNFPIVLKTMLRQDPNIIMVGEIRDTETAGTAIAAALTGHLVLSTLHTNDAPSAITRLIDMGLKNFLIATSLQGVMAQRLVRAICPNCKEPVKYTPEQLIQMGYEAEALKDFSFYKGRGCKDCNKIGYYGRIGIYELLDIDESVREMIYRMASIEEIRKAATSSGMTSLRDDGLKKAIDGKTTLEEVFRVA